MKSVSVQGGCKGPNVLPSAGTVVDPLPVPIAPLHRDTCSIISRPSSAIRLFLSFCWENYFPLPEPWLDKIPPTKLPRMSYAGVTERSTVLLDCSWRWTSRWHGTSTSTMHVLFRITTRHILGVSIWLYPACTVHIIDQYILQSSGIILALIPRQHAWSHGGSKTVMSSLAGGSDVMIYPITIPKYSSNVLRSCNKILRSSFLEFFVRVGIPENHTIAVSLQRCFP